MENISKTIETIKKLWANKKTRSLVILIMYFIFFSVVVFSVRNTNKRVNELEKNQPKEQEINTKSAIDNLKSYENYEFEYIIIDADKNENKITGMFYNNEIPFSINNGETYIYKNDHITKTGTEIVDLTLPVNIFAFQPKNIYELINNQDYYNKIKYKDGDIKTEYQLDDFNIVIRESNNYITEVDVYIKETKQNLEINYFEINNILESE